MDAAGGDRDAIFGLIALRRGVDAEVLRTAIDAIMAVGSQSLGRTLVERGAIREQDFTEIEREVRAQLDARENTDAESTIAATATLPTDQAPGQLTLADLRLIVSDLNPGLEPTLTEDLTLADPGATAAPGEITSTPKVLDLEATLAESFSSPPTSPEATIPAEPTSMAPYLEPATLADGESGAAVAWLDASTQAEPGAEPGAAGLDATMAVSEMPSGSSSFGADPAGATAKAASRLRYRIVREHAKGGLGEVFVAVDEELNREVALKEIQGRYADNVESRSRFLIEAEVTGGLEHPGIVPVYGLGQYPDGRPYYAMRFIRGQSLKEAIARFHDADASGHRDPGERAIELRRLLGHFLDICHAMAYAHARGVIHRDIKPANIMLGAFGETLVVDWGLAKTLGGPSDEPEPGDVPPLRPLSGSVRSETLYGSSIGTPQFMSPEQAAGRLDAMGPPSDLYSLGATLFALLTGAPPFGERNLQKLLDQVKRGEFPPPRQVNPRVPPALEAITLKAMALVPADRYASTRDLADDVVRWLADEPVSVYREPWTERAARWAKRHKTPVAAAAALLVATSIALLVGTILVQRERARTEVNYRLATNAVDDLLTQAGEIDLAEVPQMEPVRRMLLDRALVYYRKFLNEKRNDPGTRFETSRAYVRLADIDEMLGRYPAAEANYREAIKTLESLTAADPARVDFRRDLARARHGLGVLLRKSNRFLESEREFRAALALRKALADSGPPARAAYEDTLYHLGALLAKLSNRGPEVAEAYQTAEAEMKALSFRDPAQREYRQKRARYLNNIGIFLRPLETAKSRTAFLEALAIQKALSEESPGVAAYRWGMARTQTNLGGMGSETQQPDLAGARAFYAPALENLTRLAIDFPSVPDYRYEQSGALTNLAALNLVSHDPGRRDPRAALADLAKAAAVLERLKADYPERPDYRHKLAQVRTRQGLAESYLGRPGAAVAPIREAVDGLRRLVKNFPEVPEYESDLGLALRNLATLYDKQKVLAEHEGILHEAIDHQRRAVAASRVGKESEGSEKFRQYLAADLAFLGGYLLRKNHPTEAAKVVAEVPGLVPRDMKLKVASAQVLARCLGAFATEGSPPEGASAVAAYREMVLKILEEAVGKSLLRVDDLDGDDFRSLQGLHEFQALRKRLRQKYAVPAVG